MPDIDLHRIHNLGMKAARVAADQMADDLGRKFDLRGHWEGNVLRFERPGVTGSLALSDKDIRLSVSLGFLLMAMRGSIERAIVHELDTLFAAQKHPLPSPPPRGRVSAPAKSKKAPAPRKKGA